MDQNQNIYTRDAITKIKKESAPDPDPSAPVEGPPIVVYKKKKMIFRTYQIVWYVLGVIEVILTFRVLLKFLGANPGSIFTFIVYQISFPFILPFTGIVGNTVFGNSVIEWITFLAMGVYLVIAWGIIEFFQIIKPVDTEEVEQSVDNKTL